MTLAPESDTPPVPPIPPDTLPVTEYGGSRQEQTSRVLNDNETPFKIGLKKLSGNVSFNEKRKLFYSLNLKGSRQLNVDWWTNPKNTVAGPDGIEFMFSSVQSPNTQTLLKSSGSNTGSMWDLRLVKSGSSYKRGKLEFRLNYTHEGSASIATNAFSMTFIKSKSIFTAFFNSFAVTIYILFFILTSFDNPIAKIYIFSTYNL